MSARAQTGEQVCAVCRRTLPAAANFTPDDFSRTGYHHFCNGCRALTGPESERLLREWFGPVWDESRRLREQQSHEIARRLLGGYHWHERIYPAGQRIYALVDPRTDAVHYVGYSAAPDRRLQKHLKSREHGTNPDKTAWIAELRDAEMKPRLVILEDVADPQAVLEREARWILEQLRWGEPLTNWQAYFTYLTRATTMADFDLLTEPVDSERWLSVLDGWQIDRSTRS